VDYGPVYPLPSSRRIGAEECCKYHLLNPVVQFEDVFFFVSQWPQNLVGFSRALANALERNSLFAERARAADKWLLQWRKKWRRAFASGFVATVTQSISASQCSWERGKWLLEVQAGKEEKQDGRLEERQAGRGQRRPAEA